MYISPFVCSGIPRYSVLSFPFLFFFFFSLHFTLGILIFYCYIFKFTVSLTVSSLLVSLSKVIFISVTLSLNFFNDILFKFASLHLYYPYILAYYQLFTLEHYHIVIILSSCSINFKISVLSSCGSEVFPVSSNYISAFYLDLVILLFLKARSDIAGQRKQGK